MAEQILRLIVHYGVRLPAMAVLAAPGGYMQNWAVFLMRDLCSYPAAIRRTVASATGLFILALALSLGGEVRAAGLTATLDHDLASLGETIALSLTFSDGQPAEPPSFPAVPGLQIGYTGSSSSTSFINGQISSSITYSYIVNPRQTGDFTIPAITANVGGKSLSSQPLRFKVVQPTAPPAEAIASGSQLAFLKLALPRREYYLGESFILELDLYLSDKVLGAGQFQISSFPADGLNVGTMVQGKPRTVQIGNARYNVTPLFFPAKAIKTGPLVVGPLAANCVVQIASANRRRDPFYEQFGFRDMFEPREQKQVTLATDTENLRSLPLPGENVPAGFNGAVGSYSMSITAGPTNVTAGDPITVKVQFSGRGSLDALTLPDQAAWTDFQTYPPTSKVEATDSLGLQGTKTFEQIVVPQSASIKELPALSFSFFDPEKKTYQTLTQPPVALIVKPGGTAAVPTVAAGHTPSKESPPAQDILFIKTRPGNLALAGPLLVQRPWFLALQAIPVFGWAAGLIWRQRTENLARNPRLRRQRKVAKIIRDGLIELRQLAAANKSDEFFAALFRLLQEQLGERLDLPASAITEAVIDSHLRPMGLQAALLERVHESFQTCNLARYAPVKTSQELEAKVPPFEALLAELQKVKA